MPEYLVDCPFNLLFECNADPKKNTKLKEM